MPREEKLPEEQTPVLPEEEPVEEAPVMPEDAPVEPEEAEEAAPIDAPDSPEAPDPVDESEPADEPEPVDEPDSPPPEPDPNPRPVRIPHCLWRGWWLAVALLSIAVLMGRIDVFGVAWRRQPWRAFGGAVAVGGFLAALPGLIRHDLPERPRLRRCLLGLVIGLIWGVLG